MGSEELGGTDESIESLSGARKAEKITVRTTTGLESITGEIPPGYDDSTFSAQRLAQVREFGRSILAYHQEFLEQTTPTQ
jgi:hypothetical protein